jgi:NitT/TauT family transport system permease protein
VSTSGPAEPPRPKPSAPVEPPSGAPAAGAARAVPPRPKPWWATLRADPPAHLRIAFGLGMIGAIIFLWWLVTRGGPTEAIVSPVRLPSPDTVLDSRDKLGEVDVGHHIWMSIKRVLKGVAYASIVGVAIGVIAASYRGVAAAIAPINIFLRSVPMGAMIPLVFLFFAAGGPEHQKVMFIFVAVVAFVFSDVFKAISSVPQRYVETAETLGATRFQIIRKVLFPLALPDIITSIRFQFGLALGYIMLVETLDMGGGGIGALLWTNQRRGMPELNFALLFIIAALAFLLDFTVRYLQRGIFPYRKDL